MCFCRDVMLGVPSKVVVFFLVCLFFRTNSLYFVSTLCRQCGWWMNFADFQVCSCHFFLFLWKLFCINLWTVYQAAYRWLEKIFLLFTSSSKHYGIGLQILMVQTHSNVAWRGEKKKSRYYNRFWLIFAPKWTWDLLWRKRSIQTTKSFYIKLFLSRINITKRVMLNFSVFLPSRGYSEKKGSEICVRTPRTK